MSILINKTYTIHKTFTLCVFLFVFMTVMTQRVPAVEKKPATSTLDESSQKIGTALRADKAVFIYFYSDIVEDSADEIPMVEKLAKKHGAQVVSIDAMKVSELRYSYGVEYVPSVFLVRPDRGVSGVWIVDFTEKQLEAALTSNTKTSESQKKLAEGIKKEMPQLLFFMAKWCGYCKRTRPEIDRFENDFSREVNVVTINIDYENSMAQNYFINGVPVILLLDGNGVIRKRTGYPAGYNDFKRYFKSLGAGMSVKKASAK